MHCRHLFGATTAWLFLSGSIGDRTNDSGSRLRDGVTSTWGAPQEQKPPVRENGLGLCSIH